MGSWWPKEADPTYHPRTTRKQKEAAKLGGYDYTTSGFTSRKGIRQARKMFKRHGLERDKSLI